jgi:hypothetical protein
MKRYVKVLIALLIFITGCGIVDDPIDQAVATIDEAIVSLESQSGNWQDILEDTRKELIKQGQSTIANEVSNVLSRATSDIGIEARCYTDFLRDRVKEDLRRIRASITGEELRLKPVFCNPTPSSIDMNLDAERRSTIEISGYNLDTVNVQVFLVDNQNRRKDVSFALGNPSRYLITVNLGSNGVPLSATSDKLVFELSSGKMRPVNIIQPVPPTPIPRRTVYVSGNWTINDDETFGSDEEETHDFYNHVLLQPGQGQTIRFEECVGDEVQGIIEIRVVLNRDLSAGGEGIIYYYEGADCPNDDLEDTERFTVSAPQDGTGTPLQISVGDQDGYVRINYLVLGVRR